MTLVVPFDGSDLSKAGLLRAAQFEQVFDVGLLAVTVVPRGNVRYARDRGWIDDDEAFDDDAIVSSLRAAVAEIAPAAAFRCEFVGRYAPAGTIGNTLRRIAREVDASIVFVGSRNAGRIASTLSVGSSVASERSYDTMIVSRIAPSRIRELEAAVPTDETIGEELETEST
jgi:nucleotide-binding universal stress UspA family protein